MKIVIFIVFLAVFAYLNYSFIYQPRNIRIEGLDQQISSLNTKIEEGRLIAARLDDLKKEYAELTERLEFVEVFIKSRGNIKEVEREMGISYPTVRNKLDDVIGALGYNAEESPDDVTAEKRKEILDSLEKGEIDSKEAVELLQKI